MDRPDSAPVVVCRLGRRLVGDDGQAPSEHETRLLAAAEEPRPALLRTARLGAIDYLDVERFIAEKLKSGHGPKQVREMVSILSLIMKCAVKANARKDNPAAGHELRVPHRRVRKSRC